MFFRFASRAVMRKLQRKGIPSVRLSVEELESRRLLSGFVDNFEAATLNPYWNYTLSQSGSFSLSPVQAHSGSQSVQMSTTNTSQEKGIQLGHTFSTPTYGTFSAWMYDTTPGSNNSNYFWLSVYDSAGSYDGQIVTDDFQGDVYRIVYPGPVSYNTSVTRTGGWHQWSINVTPTSVDFAIDGATVYTWNGNVQPVGIVTMGMGGPSWRSAETTYFDDFEFTPESTDIAATKLEWNTAQNGVDFGYKVSGADLTQDTTAALYWSSSDKFADAIGDPVYSTTIEHPVGDYGPFYVPNSVLSTPPTGATHLLLVTDPPDATHPNGLIDETDETNNEASLAIPDIQMTSATSGDPGHLTFNYQIDGSDLAAPGNNPGFDVAVYRSADDTFDPSGDEFVTEQPVPTQDSSGNGSGMVGSHSITMGLGASSLVIDPSHPYVFCVADPGNQVLETDKSNNAAYFKKHLIGVVTQGFELDGRFPAWATEMAHSLSVTDHYEDVIPFDWASDSNRPISGEAVAAGDRLASTVYAHAAIIAGSADFRQGDVIDLHFIGHSRGAVVVDRAFQDLQASAMGPLTAGYKKMTLLDPHPAHNHVPGFFSAPPGPVGWVLTDLLLEFQLAAADPEVVVPPNVNFTEVYFQHTPWYLAPGVEHLLNLWGETPVSGATFSKELTAPGIGHSEVPEWYLNNVVPSLGSPGTSSSSLTPSATSPAITGAGPSVASGAIAVPTSSEIDILYPQFLDNRGVANSLLSELSVAQAAFERNDQSALSGILNAFINHVRAQRGKHIVPEAADLFIGWAELFLDTKRDQDWQILPVH